MKSLSKLILTIVLSLVALAFASGAASAQTARGLFVLTHEVRWQNAFVPAGEYEFSLDAKGPSQLLTLRQRDGHRASFMMLVNNTGPGSHAELNRLVLVARDGQKFVQAMELPEFGITMNFAVPPESAEKELALTGDRPVPTRLR